MNMTTGEIRGRGLYYSDGLEALEIWIPVARAEALPFRQGQRVPIVLHLPHQRYEAGLRSTSRNPYVWICPDLRTPEGAKVSLSRALESCGLQKNQRVHLTTEGDEITVSEFE